MKKALLITTIVLLSLCLLGGVAYAVYVTPRYEGKFTVEEYADKISNPNFHSGKTYAPITDKNSALEIGKAAINQRFDDKPEGAVWQMCRVWQDAEEDTWLVECHWVPLGYHHYVLIRSDGTEVAIWGEK